jgi:two-component system, chemotaxis family, sensor kinase CheA
MALDIDIDLEAIMRTFSAESEELIAEMEQAAVALESQPRDDKLLEVIFRGAHTLKGNAGSLGLSGVAEFTHALEDLLQRFRNGAVPVTRKGVTLLLRSIDSLREMLPAAIAGAETLEAEHAALLKELVEGTGDAGQFQFPPGLPGKSKTSQNAEHDGGGLRNDDAPMLERSGTIRVDIQKLDRMLNLAGEITIAQGRLRQVLEDTTTFGNEALEAQAHLERLSLDLQEQIMKIRMVPVGPIFRRYHRTVRDIAVAAGKEARVVIEGEESEIDLSVVEHLKDPLTHMIRNAIDHGIEPPEIRRSVGKDSCGLLVLKAFHEGGGIVIQVIDDGAGLNRERIVARAKDEGILAEPEKLPNHLLYRIIFEPGFSTAQTITDLSGRGFGMDVVRRNIEALRGSVAVDSEFGKGTKLTIRLPLTLAIIDGFGVGVGDETFILPLHAVRECLTLPDEERLRNDRQGVIDLRGEPLPYVRLRQWLGLQGPCPTRENIVVVTSEQIKAGFAVDALYGPRQTVIKPLGKQFQDLPGIAGSAILGNGRVALILDVPGLLRDMIRASGNSGNGRNTGDFLEPTIRPTKTPAS